MVIRDCVFQFANATTANIRWRAADDVVIDLCEVQQRQYPSSIPSDVWLAYIPASVLSVEQVPDNAQPKLDFDANADVAVPHIEGRKLDLVE